MVSLASLAQPFFVNIVCILFSKNVSVCCIVGFHHNRKCIFFVSCNKPFALTSRRKLSQQKWRFFLYCYLLYHKSFLFKKLLIAFFWLFSVDRVENKTLALHKVTRSQMGSYLCIATNGYPPAVSKKVQLKVNCKFQFIYTVFENRPKSRI